MKGTIKKNRSFRFFLSFFVLAFTPSCHEKLKRKKEKKRKRKRKRKEREKEKEKRKRKRKRKTNDKKPKGAMPRKGSERHDPYHGYAQQPHIQSRD